MSDDDRTRNQRESDAFNARGIEAADRKWYDEAVRAFRRAIELDPDSAHAHDNLATVYSEQGQYRLALAEYLEALKLEPDNPTAHYNLACFLTAHAHEMAIQEYTEAIDIEYDYPDAHVNLGLCYVDVGDHENAIAEFRIATELDPEDVGARQELAASLIDVVRLEGDNVDAYIDLGIAYMEQGFYAEAERAFRSAAEIAPNEVLAIYHLAALYAAWDRREDALRNLEAALSVDPERVRDWVASDRMLDGLRTDAEFARLFEDKA